MWRILVRILFSLILAIPLLIVGPDPLSARSLPAIDRSLLAPETSASAGVSAAAVSGHAAFMVHVEPVGSEYLRYMPDLDRPDEWEPVDSVAGTAYYAGDFVGHDYSKLYVIDYTLKQLHTLDTDTGADTTIGGCTPLSGQDWTGATGTADGTLYASSSNGSISYLYGINTSTGAASLVGQITNAPGIIDIAINADGEMYGVDVVNDNLVQINPNTGAGTAVGSIGFDADNAQGMDFDPGTGDLYLAAYNVTSARGELRLANTSTGSSTLVGAFADGDEVGAFALTPPPSQVLENPGFESGWSYWYTAEGPILAGTSHSGAQSVLMTGETCWVWQEVSIPGDALEVVLDYWVSGISSDTDYDNDLLCGSIWDASGQIQYVDECFGLAHFTYYPGTWRHRVHRLTASELASVAGKRVLVAFDLSQDWIPGYSDTSTAYLDDTALRITRPIYDYAVYLPLVIR